MKNDRKIDFAAMVSELKPWPRTPKVFKAILGMGYAEIHTIEEIKKIYYSFPFETNGPSKAAALFRWIDLSQKSVDKATSRPEAQKAWEECPTGSYVKEVALMKMLEFSTTKKEVKAVFSSTAHTSLVYRKALERLTKFYEIK